MKERKSISLSEEIVRFIEKNRGHLSFSAFTELLIREGIRAIQGVERLREVERGEIRRRVVMVRQA